MLRTRRSGSRTQADRAAGLPVDGSEGDQNAILDALPAQVAILDPEGIIVAANKAWRMFAESNAIPFHGHGVGLNYLAAFDEDTGTDAECARAASVGIRAVLDGEQHDFSLEYGCRAPLEKRWFLLKVTRISAHASMGAVITRIDITEQHDADEKIRRLGRIHAMRSAINALIVRATGREQLFSEASRIAVEQGGFRLACVGVVDKQAAVVRPMAFAGEARGYFDLPRPVMGRDGGLVPLALKDMRAATSNDVHNDTRIRRRKELAELGVLSLGIVPLTVGAEPVGTLSLYSGEANFFDAGEVLLLEELGADIAFAIDYLDKQARLNYLAYYDPLTGLATRGLFLDRVAQHLISAVAAKRKVALFVVDLERFRSVNDDLGRATGDKLLRHVADLLTLVCADANLLGRVGPDHFAVVLPAATRDGDAARLLETLLEFFANNPCHDKGTELRIPVRVGVAVFPDDGEGAEVLFRNAEAALKRAKSNAANFLFYTQKMTGEAAGMLTLEGQLRQALEREEFVLHYQPKVNLTSGKVVGAEALIRWNDPRTGLVPPGKFIPVLEETGLINGVGRWALRQAIEDYLRWREAGLAPVRVAVNVSPMQLRQAAFVDDLGQVLGHDVRAATALEIEITESLIMEDVTHNIANLNAIRARGVNVALDDFGTGFSSLSHLTRLPMDTLKIDGSFVSGMTEGHAGLALVSTIIELAHCLNLKVVAECVETEEQARLLRLLACDEMQGYLFSKPVPCATFEKLFLTPATTVH